ncbi:MAG TPA: tetratricopeptide repeat protein [Bacteroidales bacterium]|nr:tetratricopeptide repeat protein [Bacteroidales bacterium]
MSPETLRNWIETPGLMDRHSQSDLKLLLRNYPCFAGAQVLLLKVMEQEGDLNFSEELFKTSLMVPNRKALYYFMKELPYPPETAGTTGQSDFGLVDQFLEEYTGDGEQLQVEMPDYFQLNTQQSDQAGSKQAPFGKQEDRASSHHTPLGKQEEPTGSRSEKQEEQDLIDKFLSQPAEHIQIDKSYEEQVPETAPVDEYPEASFTETLAKIYLKQGKYEKALEIFNKLLLKYPEKSIYFADQIRFLDKLIHHLKK